MGRRVNLRGRHSVAGLHGKRHVDRQRLVALAMIGTGLGRMAIWAALAVAYLLHAAFAEHLFASVAFVSLLSILALLFTDWSQVVASFAALVGGDTHHDAEETRRAIGFDMAQVEKELTLLANASPGDGAEALKRTIVRRLRGRS